MATILASGVMAGASPEDVQSKEAEVGSAQERLEAIRMESSAAYETYNSALFQLNELDERIGATAGELGSAEERMVEAQASLEDRASQVYRSGNVGFLDVLVGADSFAEFSSRMNIWLRLLGEEQARFEEMREATEDVEAQKTALENQRAERVSALEEAGSQRDFASEAEAEAQSYFDSLNGELQAAIEEEDARMAEEARQAAEQAAAANAEANAEASAETTVEAAPVANVEPVEAAPAENVEPAESAPAANVEPAEAAPAVNVESAPAAANVEPVEVAQVEEGPSAEELAAQRDAALAAQQRAEELAAQQQAAEEAAAEAERQAEVASQREAEDAANRQAEAEAAREAVEEAAVEQEAAERAAAEQAAAEQAAAAQQAAADQAAAEEAAAEEAVDQAAANQAAADQAAEEAAAADQAAMDQAAAEDAAAADQAAADQAAADQAAADQAAGQVSVENEVVADTAQPDETQYGGSTGGEETATQPDGSTGGETAAPPSGGSANGGGIVGAAQAQLGVPYVYGGASPSGFDCSGLVMHVMAQFGVSLPHNAQAQFGYGSPGSGAAGDVVFWGGGGGITHNGIATGSGTVIHAPYPGTVVREEGIWSGVAGYKTMV
ncbi:MAG: C40 family peptidase [Rubrobacter sp.]|nr:C40 family peptidase [Rubrobacter sp.]